jgi:rod shape determining protein RodA
MALLDPTNPLYSQYATQQQNSIMAIGSGQLWGKGLNNSVAASMNNSNYIIEPQTDFIFAVAGEELGFVGCAAIIILLFLISLECILIGRRAKDTAGKLICGGMAVLIGFQSFVNICVATGLMPNTGVTLPFVSYGLTSLISLFMGMGVVLNIGLQPKKISKGGYL